MDNVEGIFSEDPDSNFSGYVNKDEDIGCQDQLYNSAEHLLACL